MISDKTKVKKIGITCSSFDLFHAGHIVMLEEAKRQCDWLIAAIQLDPTIDRPNNKNKPIQSIIERQLQVSACRYVDEIIFYSTEKELEEIFLTFPLNVRIIGEEYKNVNFTAKQICIDRKIDIYYNRRDHNLSSTELRSRIFETELKRRGKIWEENISNV
jgi:glycerol-3-phosphate cytidylyltransferase